MTLSGTSTSLAAVLLAAVMAASLSHHLDMNLGVTSLGPFAMPAREEGSSAPQAAGVLLLNGFFWKDSAGPESELGGMTSDLHLVLYSKCRHQHSFCEVCDQSGHVVSAAAFTALVAASTALLLRPPYRHTSRSADHTAPRLCATCAIMCLLVALVAAARCHAVATGDHLTGPLAPSLISSLSAPDGWKWMAGSMIAAVEAPLCRLLTLACILLLPLICEGSRRAPLNGPSLLGTAYRPSSSTIKFARPSGVAHVPVSAHPYQSCHDPTQTGPRWSGRNSVRPTFQGRSHLAPAVSARALRVLAQPPAVGQGLGYGRVPEGALAASREASENNLGGTEDAIDVMTEQLAAMRSNGLSNCPSLWRQMSRVCPNHTALLDTMHKEKHEWTFAEMERRVRGAAGLFAQHGVGRGSNVAVFGDNSAMWLMADHGTQLAGAASAVRGADAPTHELRYMYEHSDSRVAVLQGPKLVRRLAAAAAQEGLSCPLGFTGKYGDIKAIFLMQSEGLSEDDLMGLRRECKIPDGIPLRFLGPAAEEAAPVDDMAYDAVPKSDVATIVYTSGTTGEPKGVQLTHANLLHQLSHRLVPSMEWKGNEPMPGEVMLSLLPVWHITERTFELWQLSRGCKVVYSSIRTFKQDLAAHRPQWLVLVPRVLEKVEAAFRAKSASASAPKRLIAGLATAVAQRRRRAQAILGGSVENSVPPAFSSRVAATMVSGALAPLDLLCDKLVWAKVRESFGGSIKAIISGGSMLSGSLEDFYNRAGLPVIVGYGLTETSPVIAFRRIDSNLRVAGCVGTGTQDTELRVVDPSLPGAVDMESERPSLRAGEVGQVVVRGPQVMKGYHKNEDATRAAIDRAGWFNTGDLGKINPATGDLILVGRCKDTIVLSNGENVEPQSLEDAILTNTALVDQVMVTDDSGGKGGTGRRLLAVTVLNHAILETLGFLDAEASATVRKATEEINDPTCTRERCAIHTLTLQAAFDAMIEKHPDVVSVVVGQVKQATSAERFRVWERVNDCVLTLVPFAMVNGMMTQSFKVRRQSVTDQYVVDVV